MATLLDETRQQLRARLKELQPYIEEARQLEQALTALSDVREPTASPRRAAGRRRSTGSPSRARRGQRRQQMIDFLRSNPTAGPSAAAGALGISPSQASTLVRRLKDEKVISQNEGRWVVTAQ